jgi:predicted DNA-binding protein
LQTQSAVPYDADMPSPSARRPATRQVNFRLPEPICQRLEAAAAVLKHTQAGIVTSALEAYLGALPAKDRQLIDMILARHQKP